METLFYLREHVHHCERMCQYTTLMCTIIERKKHWSISRQFPCLKYCTGSTDLILLCSSHRHKLRLWNKFHKCVLMKKRNNVGFLSFFNTVNNNKETEPHYLHILFIWQAADFTQDILFQVLYSCLWPPISFPHLGVFNILQSASTKTQHTFHIIKP
jgi:hypothetical protein